MAQVFTDANFTEEVLNSDLPVLIDFFADWCGPCQMMAPVINELSEENAGKIKIGKVDVDASPQIAQKYGIMSIPSLKIFKKGEVVEDMLGAMPKEALQAKINAHI